MVNVKNRVIYFLLTVLLISMISSGCSRDGELVDNNDQLTEGSSLLDESKYKTEDVLEDIDKTSEEDNLSDEKEMEGNLIEEKEMIDNTPEENEMKGSSPWKLISESSVETKVEYAGFLNEAIGIAVGYAGETSYTEDGGKSWSKSDNVSACRYGLDLYNEFFIVSSGNSGVNLLSNDKGKSWTKLADFPLKLTGDYNKFLSIIDQNNIYISSRISLGVSNDGGTTWKELKVPEGCNHIAGMFFITADMGYLLSMDGTLYITKDSCETWTTKAIDLQGEKINSSKMPSVAINFQNENQGMIVYSTGSYKVYCIRTEDGGDTWEIIDMPKVYCFAPYLSRDGQYLTLSSTVKKICLYKLDNE
ncbi:MAG: hypothetical protein GX271_02355 [Clostridiales bacterium]|nr:hypothetical protein [Clostridiales bacterium]